MGKKGYVGVDGTARDIRKTYAGVEGIARKVRKAYVGLGGSARPCWSSSSLDYYGAIANLTGTARTSIGTASVADNAIFLCGYSSATSGATTSISSYSSQLVSGVLTSACYATASALGVSTPVRGSTPARAIIYPGYGLSSNSYYAYYYGSNLSQSVFRAKDKNTPTEDFSRAGGCWYVNGYVFQTDNGAKITPLSVSNMINGSSFNVPEATSTRTTVCNGTYMLLGGGLVSNAISRNVYYTGSSCTIGTAGTFSVPRYRSTGNAAEGRMIVAGNCRTETYPDLDNVLVDHFDENLVLGTPSTLRHGRWKMSNALSAHGLAIFMGGDTGLEGSPALVNYTEVFDKNLTRTNLEAPHNHVGMVYGAWAGDYLIIAGGFETPTSANPGSSAEAYIYTPEPV